MFFFYPNQRELRNLKNLANRIINILIVNKLFKIPHLNHDILRIEFLYIFTKMKYQTYQRFHIERFSSFLSSLFEKFLDRPNFNWKNRSDWAHKTYRNDCTNFHIQKNRVHWTHLYSFNRFTIKKQFIIAPTPFSRRRISPQE
jgi:hypothetical protein